MADDKTTKTPEQPVTDSGPGKETPPAPPKEPEKVSVSPEPEKKTEPEVKNPQVSVYGKKEQWNIQRGYMSKSVYCLCGSGGKTKASGLHKKENKR